MPKPRMMSPKSHSRLPNTSELSPDSDEDSRNPDECLRIHASLEAVEGSDFEIKKALLDQLSKYRHLSLSIRKSDRNSHRAAILTFDTFDALNSFKRAILDKRDRIIVNSRTLFFNFHLRPRNNDFNRSYNRESNREYNRGYERSYNQEFDRSNEENYYNKRQRQMSNDSYDAKRGKFKGNQISDQTRTLFVGNLDENVTESELKSYFSPFGEIIECVIKKPNQSSPVPFAFVKFRTLTSALRARDNLQSVFIGRNRVKIGFGRATPSLVVWVGGLNSKTQKVELDSEVRRFARFLNSKFYRDKGYAYYQFERVLNSRDVKRNLVNIKLPESSAVLETDYADPSVEIPEFTKNSEMNDISPREKRRITKRNSRQRSQSEDDRNRLKNRNQKRSSRDSISDSISTRSNRDSSTSFQDSRRSEKSSQTTKGHINKVSEKMSNSSHSDSNDEEFTLGAKSSSENSRKSSAITIFESYPVVWRGALCYKDFKCGLNLHLVCGKIDPISSMVYQATLVQRESQTIKLSSKMAMVPEKEAEIRSKLASAIFSNECCILVGLNAESKGKNDDEGLKFQKIVNLIQKAQIAGVDRIGSSSIYAFPPSNFSQEQLTNLMPHVASRISNSDSYLLIVVSK